MKKKITAIITALALVLSLAGCGKPAQPAAEQTQTAEPNTSAQDNTPTEPTAQEPAMPTEPVTEDPATPTPVTEEPQIATFGASSDKFIEVLRGAAADSDYPDLFSGKPTTTEKEADASLPAHIITAHEICPGASLMLYTVRESDEMYQAFLTLSKSKVGETDMFHQVGYVIGLMESALEPDTATRMELNSVLDLGSVRDSIDNVATGTVATWAYTVEADTITLTVTAD